MPFVYQVLLELGFTEAELDGEGMLGELRHTAEGLEFNTDLRSNVAIEQAIDEMQSVLRKIEKALKEKYG